MAKLDNFMHARIFRKFKDDPYYANVRCPATQSQEGSSCRMYS